MEDRISSAPTIAGVIAALGIAVFSLVGAAPAAAQIELRLNKIVNYIPAFPHKRAMVRAYRNELETAQEELQRRQLKGENLACSAQILQEVQWLVRYTVRRADVDRRLADLRKSFETSDQAFASQQDPKDGSFGPCFESWLWRFYASVDPLKELALRNEKPKVPLKIWEHVDTPEKITALMESLLISDLADGYIKRKELNLAVDFLGQLLWLDYTAVVFPEHLDRRRLAAALTAFVDEKWQDPETGYWGAWYRDGNEIRKTNDLSHTFHIISYRGGNVQWPKKIAQTTFSIRSEPYPYGWEGGGMQNNHHAYDVARIISLTWDDLDATQQSTARAVLMLLVSRSIGLSIDDDGSFDPAPYSTVGEAYYFGISFFAEVGVLQTKNAGPNRMELTNTGGLLERIEQKLNKLDSSDPMVAAAKRKLAPYKQ